MSHTDDELEYYEDIRELVGRICRENSGHALAKRLDQVISAFHSLVDQDDRLFERILQYGTFPNWIRRLEANGQIQDERGKQLVLREHCYLLGYTIGQIQHNGYFVDELVERDGEIVGWEGASEWLDIAASIERVGVDTLYFDESLLFCSTARSWENSRSDVLSHLATQLAIFNFAWGSFETITKLIDPPRVPKSLKPGHSSIVDRAIYYLKTVYEPERTLTFYNETVADMREILKALPYYAGLTDYFRLERHMGTSGVGINVVRKIRNRFAHGAMAMPQPLLQREEEPRPLDAQLVELSSRIILYTTQMLLLAFLKGKDFDVMCRTDENGLYVEESVQVVLRALHLKRPECDRSQLPLLPSMSK